jgi:hypothetical protein
MNSDELFIESHHELVEIIKWINKPIVLVERGSIEPEALQAIEKGTFVFTHDNSGVLPIRQGLPQELINKVVESFLESHRKIK